MSKTLYLVRHAEPETEFTGRFLGRLNPGLSPNGVAQAEALAPRLAALKPARIISSPLLRAWQTAGILGSRCGITVEKDDALLEINFGKIEGMTFQEAAKHLPGMADSWQALSGEFSFPDGENYAAFHARTSAVAHWARTCPDDAVVLVAHGGVLRGVLGQLVDISPKGPLRFRFAYAALTTVTVKPDGNCILENFNRWRTLVTG